MIRPTRATLLWFTAGLPLAALPAVIGPGLWSYWFVAVLTELVDRSSARQVLTDPVNVPPLRSVLRLPSTASIEKTLVQL